MAWAVREAEEKLTPPPSTLVYEAAEKAAIFGDDGVEWASTQLIMFLELSRQRGRGQTLQPLSFVDIEAYQRLHRFEFNLVELNNILLLDQIFMEFVSEMAQQQMAEMKAKAGA